MIANTGRHFSQEDKIGSQENLFHHSQNELLELRDLTERKISYYLIVDDRFTWWTKGKSYLCRIVYILQMGLVDEVLVGKEVPLDGKASLEAGRDRSAC